MSNFLRQVPQVAAIALSLFSMHGYASPSPVSISIDLTQGTLVNSSRVANGHVENVSPASVDLVGSDGPYSQLGQGTTLTYANPITSATYSSTPRFIGTDLPLGEQVDYTGFVNLPAPGETRAAFEVFANRFNVPTSAYPSADTFDGKIHDSKTFYFAEDVRFVKVSFDYSWSSADQPGYDSAYVSLLGQGYELSKLSGGSHHFEAMSSGYYPTLHPVDPSAALQYVNFSNGITTGTSIGPITFSVNTVDNLYGPGTLRLSNLQISDSYATRLFEVVVTIPEPDSGAAMIAGLLTLGVLFRRKSDSLNQSK